MSKPEDPGREAPLSGTADISKVLIFDTTLRDGEQSPGISLNTQEKLESPTAGPPGRRRDRGWLPDHLARRLRGGAGDRPEGGRTDHRRPGPNPRGRHRRGLERGQGRRRPRIHTFISTSDIHIEYQLQTTRDDVKGQARAAVAHAKQYVDDVEFSPMDATRADIEFTAEVCRIAIDEGATTINIPDTVGYTMPHEYTEYLRGLYELVPGLKDIVLSVHCHDDLGLAVANSFAGLLAGARQVECAINGIGERAGNASLEEIVMLLHTRERAVGLRTGIQTREIARTSRLVSRLTGYSVQPNKAIVGRNAFAHESGIHQDGVLKERSTYEIMDATTVGLEANSIVLGKHSGRHALQQALADLGFELSGQGLNTAFRRFKEIADKKKHVTAMDLEALVTDELREEIVAYQLEWFDVEASSRRPPHATVGIRTPDGEEVTGSFTGDGPVDAIFRAINAATGSDARLREFRVDAVTGGQDALGETSVVLEVGGISGSGQGVSTDILEAAARAYVRALSNAVRKRGIMAEAEAATAAAASGSPVETP